MIWPLHIFTPPNLAPLEFGQPWFNPSMLRCWCSLCRFSPFQNLLEWRWPLKMFGMSKSVCYVGVAVTSLVLKGWRQKASARDLLMWAEGRNPDHPNLCTSASACRASGGWQCWKNMPSGPTFHYIAKGSKRNAPLKACSLWKIWGHQSPSTSDALMFWQDQNTSPITFKLCLTMSSDTNITKATE